MQVKILYKNYTKPEEKINYATEFSAGLDLRAMINEEEIKIPAGERVAINTGIAIEITDTNYAGFVYSRSGLGAKTGLTVAQGVGVIDPDYRGEIIVFLLNTSKQEQIVKKGDRIAQLIFQPIMRAGLIETDELTQSSRGTGGFGHTGKK